MQFEEARGFLFQAIRQEGWNQFGQLLSTVGMIVARARETNVDPVRVQGYGHGVQFLTDQEKTLMMEVVWSLIIQGILIPGLNDSNQGWPFLRLTEYGARCVLEDRVLPHDPDGFPRGFSSRGPSRRCYGGGVSNRVSPVLHPPVSIDRAR